MAQFSVILPAAGQSSRFKDKEKKPFATLDGRAVRMIGARPITGFGYGNFERFDEGYKQRVGDVPLKTGGSAHNTYLNLAVELGIPAVVLYFSIPLWLLAQTIRRRATLQRRTQLRGL